MKIKEIMTRKVKTLPADMSAKDALEILDKLKISGLPVIDKNTKLVGMFTEKDILSYVLPHYIEQVGAFTYRDNPKSAKKKLAQLGTIPVAQLMRKEVVTVTEDAALCEVARVILTKKARRIPVLDKNGKVVGIVARCDVLGAMMKEAKEA